MTDSSKNSGFGTAQTLVVHPGPIETARTALTVGKHVPRFVVQRVM